MRRGGKVEGWRVFLGNGVWSGFYLAATRRWPHCSLMLANPAKSGTADESGTVSAMLWTPCEKCDLVREERFGNSAWPPSVTGSRPSLPRMLLRFLFRITKSCFPFPFFFFYHLKTLINDNSIKKENQNFHLEKKIHKFTSMILNFIPAQIL